MIGNLRARTRFISRPSNRGIEHHGDGTGKSSIYQAGGSRMLSGRGIEAMTD